ncbi:MAG: hypothetical protein ACREP9_00850, partial [Candidatus Dormibacteraceae bacterium]
VYSDLPEVIIITMHGVARQPTWPLPTRRLGPRHSDQTAQEMPSTFASSARPRSGRGQAV